jgi:hypothetical protein
MALPAPFVGVSYSAALRRRRAGVVCRSLIRPGYRYKPAERATTTGLTIKAYLDEGIYRKGQEITREDLERLILKSHCVCPSWNYTINARQELLPKRSRNPH